MAGAIDMHNAVSPDTAKKIIRKSVEAVMDNPKLSRKLPPILLRGKPGVGKSTLVKDIADELGIGFIDIRLAQREPVDLRGLPVPNEKDKSVEWYVTGDLPRDPNSKGILFFDELTSADKSLQVASYELILDRRLGELYKIPDGWFIVAAGNCTTDRAVATTMSSALANRLMHFEVKSDAEDWGAWAVSHDIHPSVTGYIKYRPANLLKMEQQNLEQGWPSPRSWERVSNIIELFKDDEETLRKAVYGLVGNAVGLEFMEFHKINKNFDDVLVYLTDPKAKIHIPDRADQRYAMTSAVSYLLWNGKNENDDKERVEGLYRIIDKLTPDFAQALVKNAMLGNTRVSKLKAMNLIMKSPSYKAYAAKYKAESTSSNAKL